ncbi:MAG: mechanosensitive ion channel family protein [Luminiphilus sp.]|nr:mechanosensitive ion channel family protein [Luminiphilus sp.]MDG2443036.1 mechanosensitive ion channel family protein [Luminiphilus sp.]
MEVSAQFLARELAPFADYLHVPAAALVIAVLLALGLLGHIAITRLVGKLQQSAERSVMRWDNVFTEALLRPSKWAVWLLVVYLSLGLFEGAEQFRTLVRQAADTALILILAWIAQRALKGAEAELLSEHRGQRQSDDRATIRATLRLVRISLGIVVLLMVLQSLGVSVSGLLAFGGIGGIAVGFAARDLLANFLGGLSIYLDRPFTVGDWIRSPDREIEGTVEDIGWRMTRIRTFDQRPLYIPNSIFASVAVENPSRMNNRRIYETVGIRYDDVAVMGNIVANVKAMLESHEAIDLKRTLMVNFVSCGPSSLDFFIYTFTKTTDWATFHGIKQDILLRVLTIIADEGAEVAFPTRTLLLESEPDLKAVDP